MPIFQSQNDIAAVQVKGKMPADIPSTKQSLIFQSGCYVTMAKVVRRYSRKRNDYLETVP